jgi:hypothetical protein
MRGLVPAVDVGVILVMRNILIFRLSVKITLLVLLLLLLFYLLLYVYVLCI